MWFTDIRGEKIILFKPSMQNGIERQFNAKVFKCVGVSCQQKHTWDYNYKNTIWEVGKN